MTQPPDPKSPEPSVSHLIGKGVRIIVVIFILAMVILLFRGCVRNLSMAY